MLIAHCGSRLPAGVAVYFMSPLWPYSVTTSLSLDSDTPTLLDLRDYSQAFDQDAPETAASAVVWGATGLANTQHQLIISVGAGQATAIVDGIMYIAPSLPSHPLILLPQLHSC